MTKQLLAILLLTLTCTTLHAQTQPPWYGPCDGCANPLNPPQGVIQGLVPLPGVQDHPGMYPCASIAVHRPDGTWGDPCYDQTIALHAVDPVQPIQQSDIVDGNTLVVHLKDDEKKLLADAKKKLDDAQHEFDNARGLIQMFHPGPENWTHISGSPYFYKIDADWSKEGFLILTREENGPVCAWGCNTLVVAH